MVRLLCLAACAYFFFGATAFANPVTLRPSIEASGPAVTLGDVFDGVSADIAGRAIAPAPPAGQVSSLAVPVLSAVASAAGLEWTPPAGVTSVRVVHPGGARATVAPEGGGRAVADALVRRGQPVMIVYEQPGFALTLRGRALEDAGLGQSVRVLNTSSNQTIDAVVTGPGAARASP
jgi:hypothetical protein